MQSTAALPRAHPATSLPAPQALLEENMPDPFVFTQSSGQRWMTATCSARPYAFPLYEWRPFEQRFAPLMRGGQHQTIFPEGALPHWWNQGELSLLEPWLPPDLLLARWAPEIFEISGKLLLTYTARDRRGLLRTATAVSDRVEGPWLDNGPLEINPRVSEILVGEHNFRGSADLSLGVIDATVAKLAPAESGKPRQALVVKVDGNALNWYDARTGELRSGPTPWVAREFILTPGGQVDFVGTPHVLHTDQPHHDGLIEGPFFFREAGQLYVIYSAGYFGDGEYRTYLGEVDDVLNGGVVNERLLLQTGSPAIAGEWEGPGHGCVDPLGDGLYALYLHAWRTGETYDTHGEGRKALRFHLSFRDQSGAPCEPFVVENGSPACEPKREAA